MTIRPFPFDEDKTAVISQRGMGLALGLGEGGTRLPRFVNGKTISAYVGPELRVKLEKPIIFQWATAGQNIPPLVLNGYVVTILINHWHVVAVASIHSCRTNLQRDTHRLPGHVQSRLLAQLLPGRFVTKPHGFLGELLNAALGQEAFRAAHRESRRDQFDPFMFQSTPSRIRLAKPAGGLRLTD